MQDATIVRFPGNPDELIPRYAEGLKRFSATHPGVRPQTIFVGRSETEPNALVAIVLWPEGIDHGVLGGFLLPLLKELGIAPPRVEHLAIDRVGFDVLLGTM